MRKLRTQLSLAFLLIVLITVSIISFLSNVLIGRQFHAYKLAGQEAKAQSIVDNLSIQYDHVTNKWNMDSVHTLGMYSLFDGYIIKVRDINGDNVWDAENHDMATCMSIMEDISNRMKEHGTTGDFVTHEFTITQNGKEVGSVSIQYFGPYFLSEGDFKFLDSLNLLLMVVGVFSLLFSFIMAFVLAKRISHPITETAEIAKQIASGNYDTQFEGQTKTQELYHLVTSINYLANALSKQEKLRKQLTADVAHELRTPITTLGSHLEAMIEKVWEPTTERLKSCHEEILRLGKIVMDLESLERAESDNLELNKTPIDLLELTRSVCVTFDGELSNKNLKLEIDGEISVVSIDKDRFSGVITNLVSNAVKYTKGGGRIRILIQDFSEESVFVIEDNGVGIPEEELPFIFERFYRADKSRNRKTGGAGIGLTIVKSVVTAHGGTITAQNGSNGGCVFEIRIPKLYETVRGN
ncbi:MAG: ATP-binding protein [Lachnospiraceae bacterium]|nr:ATP-binding protein [Lachnospiraceae bacterium]